MSDTTTRLNAAADAYNATEEGSEARAKAFIAVCEQLFSSHEACGYVDDDQNQMDIESLALGFCARRYSDPASATTQQLVAK